MLDRGVLTMNSSRTSRQRSPPQPPPHVVDDGCDSSALLSNPSYDIITGDVGQFTTQYYHTVEPSEGLLSPKDGGPGSTSDSSSSGRSKTSSTSSDEGETTKHHHRRTEQESPMSDDVMRQGVPHSLEYIVQPSPQKVAVSMCGGVSGHGAGGEGSSVKHWSYEEQFKQLYNLSPEAERKEFLDKLFDYMQKKGSPITRVPIMAKQPLDLYRLFKLVVERGGLVEVIKKKAWRAVAKELNLPASITSAAFTMRSQYVKYLYPFECEVESLSDPQELQVAIDSHKRDRRQSDTAEIMHQSLPMARGTLDNLTPVTNTITTPQGIQILSSPTVALPHGTIPPYSGSFIVTGPGGAQMVTPQISGPPQLVQMTTTPHGIPIMVPALTQKHDIGSGGGGGGGEDRDDTSSQASSEASDRESSVPPPKRVAMDIGGRTVAAARIPSVQGGPGAPTGFMMTPTRHIVPTSHLTSPHVVMGHNSHIPIVMPTTTTTAGFLSPQTSSPIETVGVANGIVVKDDGSRRSPLENGGCSPRLIAGGHGKPTQVIPASHLLQMNPHSHPVPLVVPTNTVPITHHHGNTGNKYRPSTEFTIATTSSSSSPSSSSHSTHITSDHSHHSSLPTATEKPHAGKHNGGVTTPQNNHTTTPSSIKMPFANISIQSANKDGEGDSTLLVTLEINDTIFQGVLFAKPNPTNSGSPSR